ncbi:Tethering factor for nuclear proteasome sts1 [Choanephora cucurbitarum]|uniref:Tethering factor for nuclear proteasome STS1 n=1 Tax=Choanephora cucurbitarum TaxID=101091 RepID=A0A1C7N5J9_9FUNG|nr:Tethering factor for nuclear proteasome sts1 [Choanephora cucurbitarum]
MTYLQVNQSNDMYRGRKRRPSEDEEMTETTTSRPMLTRKSKSPEQKRQRTHLQKRSTRGALLETLDKEALVNIIDSLLKTQPIVQRDIMNYIPAPTIHSAIGVLSDLEKKFIQSFPFKKHGPGRDDYTFSRVQEALTDLVDTITQYANHFTSSQIFPSNSFTFLNHVTHMAHRLPDWDNEENNQLKKELYRDLNLFWKTAIQATAAKLTADQYSPDSVREWAKQLAQHHSYTDNNYFTESVVEFSRQLGYWMDSNHQPTFPSLSSSTHHHCLTPLENTLIPSHSVVGDRR